MRGGITIGWLLPALALAPALALTLASAAIAQSSADKPRAGWLPGLGAQLMDSHGKPSLTFSLMSRPMPHIEAESEEEDASVGEGEGITTRFVIAAQRYSAELDGTAPNSDATISAVGLRAFRLVPLTNSWYASVGVGYHHLWLTESWVSLDDESLLAQVNRGDLLGHLGISYRWQRESALIWLDVLGIQLRAVELLRGDNLSGLDVLPFWKIQLRRSFHDYAERRLHITLLGITVIPTD